MKCHSEYSLWGAALCVHVAGGFTESARCKTVLFLNCSSWWISLNTLPECGKRSLVDMQMSHLLIPPPTCNLTGCNVAVMCRVTTTTMSSNKVVAAENSSQYHRTVMDRRWTAGTMKAIWKHSVLLVFFIFFGFANEDSEETLMRKNNVSELLLAQLPVNPSFTIT